MVREEGSSRVRAFFLAFRKNLGVSLVWGLVMIMAIALVLYEASVIVRAGIEGPVGVLLHAGLLSGLLMLGAISVWLFPILEAPASRMRTNLAQALQLAIVHLPRTLATLAIPIVSTASWLFLPDQRGMLLALSFVCLPALGAYVANLLVQPVLRPHLVQPDR